MKTAALYIRVSTEDQKEYSPDAQKRILLEYAKNNDFYVDKEYIFIDEGFSGRKAEKRPAFMRMIALAKTKPKPFDAIIVHKFDRFARSREDSIVYKRLLRKDCDIQVLSSTEPMEDGKMSLMMESILETMAEYYSLNLADEVKKGMTEKALRGGIQCAAPFGYRNQDNSFVIVEDERPIVEQIFRDFVSGKSLYKIALDLNDSGIRTRRGNKWELRTVRYLIKNPTYKGYVRWNPAGKHDLRTNQYDSDDFIIAKGNFEPIVSEELWTNANARVCFNRTPAKPAELYKNWMSGILVCSSCGEHLASGGSSGGYQCIGYTHGRCRTSHYISTKIAEQLCIEALSDMATGGCMSFSPAPAPTNSLDRLNAALEKAERMARRAKESYLAGIDTIDEYRQNKSSIQAEIDRIQKEIASASVAPVQFVTPERISSVVALLKSDADKVAKNTALKSIVDRIVFDRKSGSFDVFLLG